MWWDGNTSTPNSASDNANTSAQNWLAGGFWDNGATSATVASWTAGDAAIFGGSAATQTVTAGALTVGNLTFGQGGQGTGTSGTAYTVNGGTLTLSTSTITANTPALVSSTLAGSTGLTKAGPATLTLGGNTTYTGTTAVNAGTLKITAAAYTAYRYYRFTVSANFGADGYNQIGELHYYFNGTRVAASAGSSSANGASGTEQYWGNANDNKGANASGFTKFGVGGVPYWLVYDFSTPTILTSYNWSSANDSTPSRNPKRWIVAGSNDNSTWVTLDDRSGADQAGPGATYSWSSTTTTYAAVTNATNDGATNAYPLLGSGNIPTSSAVQIASGANLDLNGTNQVVAGLVDSGVSGGSVINSASTKPVALTVAAAAGSSTFSGVISDSGSANAISLTKNGAGTQILAGTNTYHGSTTVNTGLLQLSGAGQLGGGALTVNGGTFDLNALNQTVSNLVGGGTITNSAATNSTLTVSHPASTAGNFAGLITTPSTGNLNLVFNSVSGGTASNAALASAANTFKGSITINGTGFIDGNDAHGVVGINTDGALGDPSNPITLTNGGTLFNMYNPSATGGWPTLAVFTLGTGRVINVTGSVGGVIRICNGQTCTVLSQITGDGGLAKTDGGGLILGGSIANTYTGVTTLGGTGKLVLAKTGAIAIAGNINISSTGWNGDNMGVVLAADEQIADTSVITWTAGGYGGTLRLNGHTETIGGLVCTATGLDPVIENRGYNDVTSYGTGTVILNVTGSNVYSFAGHLRDTDGGSGGGAVALTKTGSGTQIMSSYNGYTGPTTVNAGLLEVTGSMSSSPVTVTSTGTLSGTGSLSGPLTVQSGGTLTPGVSGVGTLTASAGTTIGGGGTLTGTGTLGGSVIVGSGGTLSGTGIITGALTVQVGGDLAPGTAGIGNINANGAVILAGTSTFEINKSGGLFTCDTLSGFSSITYGGTLSITASGDAPALGDSYQLFVPGSGGTYGGSFSSIVGLPTLAGGLQWETTGLLGSGKITVVNYVSTPSFNPAGGGYVGGQSVTISSDPGSTIFYTIDGSLPNAFSPSGLSPITGIPVLADSVVTLQAFARKTGQADSPVAEAVYHTVTTASWHIDGGGAWSDTLNWLNEVSPNASGAPVAFTLPQTTSTSVTLDASRSAGSLTFGNTNGFGWSLGASNGASLILDTPSGTPTITTLDVTSTISAVLGGSQGFAKAGPGILVLSGNNTYSGNTAVNAGVLSVGAFASNGNNSPLGSGSTLSFNGGTLSYTGGSVGGNNFNRDISLGAGGGTLEVVSAGFWFTTGVFSGSGPLTKIGNGQLIVAGNSNYDGVTYINQAEIQIRNLNALGSSVGNTVVASGARLCAGGSLTGTINENLVLNGDGGGSGALQANDGGTNVNYAGNITLASDTAMGSSGGIGFTISGAIDGIGGFTKPTNNVITLAGSTSNTYAGATTLGSTGKLILAKTGAAIAIAGNINISTTAWNGNNMGIVLAGDEQIADTSVITWTSGGYGGTLRLNGHTETIGGLNSTSGGMDPEIENRGNLDTAVYANATLIINTVGSNSYSYNGGIRDMDGGTGSGSISLVKTGTGTQILNGGMANTGTTTINNGTLQIDCVSSAPTTTVASGATLKGSGAVIGTLAISAGGTLAPGDSVGTFSAANTTLAGTYACEFDGSICDRIAVTGSLDITGATLAITTISPQLETSYVMATYTTTLTGTFANVTGLPASYSLKYDAVNKQILLVQGGYDAWAAAMGLTVGVNDGKLQDPDGDGVSNLMEYALGGNPLSATDNGVSSGNVQTVDGSPALVQTIAARAGAVFASGTNGSMDATIDGIVYRIEGSLNLDAWTDTISEITPITGGLPAVPAGYEYHTFRSGGPFASTASDFIRLNVTEAP